MAVRSPSTLDVKVSDLLFQIYSASRIGQVGEFQRRALDSLSHLLAFDGAWWGRATVSGDEHQVHCSYVHHLPQDVAEWLNRIDRKNVVARQTVSAPGRAHYFGKAALHSQDSTRRLAEHMGIVQSVCICDWAPTPGITNFLSLARQRARPRFSTGDLALLELVAPHLSAALDMALADQLVALRHPEKTALLVTDAAGSLHVAEAGALELLRSEWSDWTGPLLPAPLLSSIASRRAGYLGKRLQIAFIWQGDHVFLSMRPRGSRDMLTRREHSVAEAYAAGQSYREIAEGLGLSPATVRHHLRAIYVKLGVNDKASLAIKLHDS